MIIYSDSKEIERIDEYDQLGQILIDLGMDFQNKSSKSYEGMGYDGSFSNMQPTIQRSGPNGIAITENDINGDTVYMGAPGHKPTQIVPGVRRS